MLVELEAILGRSEVEAFVQWSRRVRRPREGNVGEKHEGPSPTKANHTAPQRAAVGNKLIPPCLREGLQRKEQLSITVQADKEVSDWHPLSPSKPSKGQ
jgi:hypothetical protein